MTEQSAKLKNPNVFQADTPISVTQRQDVLSIRCPHCRQLGSFARLHPVGAEFHKFIAEKGNTITTMYAGVLVCPNHACRGLVFVIYDGQQKIWEIEPPQQIDFDPSGLPPRMLRTLSEAVSCHAAGAHRAAAMMVRRLLEEICEANGATGGNLHTRLAALKTKIILPAELFDAMGELKALGNDAAHIEAKSYDNIGSGEAEDCIELAKEILKALYQLKGLVARLQARKSGP